MFSLPLVPAAATMVMPVAVCLVLLHVLSVRTDRRSKIRLAVEREGINILSTPNPLA